MAKDASELGDQVHRMAEDLAKGHKSAEGMSFSISRMMTSLGAWDAAKHVIVEVVKRTETWSRLQTSLSAENLNVVGLLQRQATLTRDIGVSVIKNAKTGQFESTNLKERKPLMEQELRFLDKQVDFAQKLDKFGKIKLAVVAAAASAATALWIKQRQLNQDLIEANSSWQHRGKLMHDTLMTQAQLGISFGKITQSAAALVHYGMDTEVSFDKNLKLVSQMEQGLGVSARESAQLATIVERQLKGSFEDVSHTLAQIVDDTALAGDEAARLATNIATAMGRLRPGMGAAALPEVVRLVGRYESALKEIGGSSGAAAQLLTSLTRPEGMVGMGVLGVQPGFLASAKGVDQVMTRFARYGNMMVGTERNTLAAQMRLQMLGEQFGLNADQANQLLMAVKRTKEQQVVEITVQERWRNQLHATDQGVGRLANSLTALVQGGMWPFVWVVGALANKLADALEWVLSVKELAYVIAGGVTLGVVSLIPALWRLTTSLYAVVTGAVAATGALTRMVPALAATALASGGRAAISGGSTAALMGGAVARVAGGVGLSMSVPLIASLGVIAALLIPIGYYARKHYLGWKEAKDRTAMGEKIVQSQQERLVAQRRSSAFRAMRYGDAEGMLARGASVLNAIYSDPSLDKLRGKERWAAIERMQTEQVAGMIKDLPGALTARYGFTSLTERTQKEQEDIVAALNFGPKMLALAEAKKRSDEQRKQREIEEFEAAEENSAKIRMAAEEGTVRRVPFGVKGVW
jgi:hypothetical protein